MNRFIVAMTVKAKQAFFSAWLGACLLLAVFPPFYLWSSGRSGVLFGLPVAIAYWILDAILLIIGVATLLKVEQLRGELGAEEDNL